MNGDTLHTPISTLFYDSIIEGIGWTDIKTSYLHVKHELYNLEMYKTT